MKIVKKKTVGFVGSHNLSPKHISDRNLENVIRTELYYVIEEFYKEGKTIFLSGLRNKFEMLAAEAVLEYGQECAEARLRVVVSDSGQERKYSGEELLRYRQILENAAGLVAIDGEVYAKWNDFLIGHSSEVVVYGENEVPEVRSILEMAERKGVEAWNMYGELEGYFSFESPVKEFLQDYPKVVSFRYGRDGVIFRGDHQPFPVEFTKIVQAKRRDNWLYFKLQDGMTIMASLVSDTCYVKLPS